MIIDAISGVGSGSGTQIVQKPTVVVGTYTYDGTAQGPTITGLDTQNTIVTNATATNAGTYTLTIALKNSAKMVWNDMTTADLVYTYTISKATLTVPTVTDTTKTYNGSAQSPTITGFDSTTMTKTGDSATDAGNYTITFGLVDSTNYEWDTTNTVNWFIEKATPTLTISPNTITFDSTHTSAQSLTVTTNSDGAVTLTGFDTSLISISGASSPYSVATTQMSGTTTITVNLAASTNYESATASVAVTCTFAKIMTVKINEADSNPATCCTYYDDAVGMTAGSSDWDDFFGHYPCLFKDGAEVVKLNPNDFTKDINGNNVDITSGNSGDVMIAFPRRGLKITKSGDVITISMTNDLNANGFDYYAHTRGSTSKDVFYIGAYKGYVSNSKLRSLSGKTITNNQTIDTFRTQAQANGVGYDQTGYYQLVFRQAMYVLKYKNLNSQEAVGKGATALSSMLPTGGSESYGMDSEIIKSTTPSIQTDKQHHVKLFGVEDAWGNIFEFVDGLVAKNYVIYAATDNFNTSGNGYTLVADYGSTQAGYFMRQASGTSETGFINLTTTSGGSMTTYYCDAFVRGTADSSCGYGDYYKRDQTTEMGWAGVFAVHLNNPNTLSDPNMASRLMFL